MKKKKIALSVMKGLNEAIEYENRKAASAVRTHRVTIHPLPNYEGESIKRIRLRLHLSQKSFAYAFGVSVKTVEAWEAGKNKPAGPAQRMLSLLEKDNSLLKRYGILSVV